SQNDVSMVTIPGIEGQMGILANHVPMITFMRPGVINIDDKKNRYFFTIGGVVDFKDNALSILCQEIYDIEQLTDQKINQLKNNAKLKIEDENCSDHEAFIANTILEELSLLKSR
ncbi:MAG: ATP synthase F1 subunit epsilon, partial [Pelagibacteraceae bacterium]